MTYNIGNFCLIGLIVISATTSSALIYQKQFLAKYTYKSISLQFAIITIALLKLVESYISSDYNFVNVALNTHTLVPLLYKIAGVWGNHEGSMLLIVWLLCLINIIFMIRAKFNTSHKQSILALQSLVVFLFANFVFFVSNPFITISGQHIVGSGFNPLLQDYTLVIHPPILYCGYIGFSIVFSALILGLRKKTINNLYLGSLYSWMLIPWGFLTLGVSLGGWWAYRELGWGGFWFWDPVENVSLVVWCSAISLLHISKLTIKRQMFYRWTVLLGILTFVLAVLSLLLVRSGALVSVHSFAVDKGKGTGLLLILSIIAIIPIATWFKYCRFLPKNKVSIKVFSKDSGIVFNNIFIMTTCLIILLALLYPVLFGLIKNKVVSVGELFYTETLEFIFLPVMFLMILFPFIKWNTDSLKDHLKPLITSIFLSSLLVIIINNIKPILQLGTNLYIFSAIASIISIIIYCLSAIDYNKIPMHLGHLGFALLVLGASFCWSWQHEENLSLAEGHGHITSRNHEIILEKIMYNKGTNYLTRTAIIKIYNNNQLLGSATPETRFYPIEKTFTHESSILHSWYGDLYFTIGEITNNKKISIKIKYKPFVYLIWCGSVLMATSAFLYIFTRASKK